MIGLAACLLLAGGGQDSTSVLDFEGAFDVSTVVAWDAKAVLSKAGTGTALRVTTFHAQEWPGITLKAPRGAWDLSRHARLSMDMANVGKNAVTVGLRVDSGESDGLMNANTGWITLGAGARGTLTIDFVRRLPAPEGVKLFGMRGFPGSRYETIDPSRVTQLVVFLKRPSEDHEFEVDSIRAEGAPPGPAAAPVPADPFFPLIDELGQYIHRDWPGKARSAEELRARAAEEAKDLASRAGPAGWDRYGGWAGGPALEATGFFRVQKHEGRWWLVDPEGRLFFSHGVDCVTLKGSTPVEERETWFRGWPRRDDPDFGAFFHPAHEVLHEHYRGRTPLCFDITGANLRRKHGPEWKARASEAAHARLRGWGLNTIGNWSDEEVRLMRKTPYTVGIHCGGRSLEGSEGYWQAFRDVFDPSFAAALKDRLKGEAGRSAGDPWCLGYFVDNELSWGDETSLALATLKSPAGQAAKREFVEDLRKKHVEIGKLNAAWGTAHASWDALLADRRPPDPKRAGEDLLAFNARTATQYFKLCRDAVKEVAPRQLYLGCRFAWVNPMAAGIAAKHADVVSFNVYQRAPEMFEFAAKDAPVLIGEFHFGALDRGPFHPGLVRVRDQEERAKAYRDFVQACRRHPQVVGCHWFQFRDQPTTGRELDGENYQIGFVDIADTPYPELVAAAREAGAGLYPPRPSGR